VYLVFGSLPTFNFFYVSNQCALLDATSLSLTSNEEKLPANISLTSFEEKSPSSLSHTFYREITAYFNIEFSNKQLFPPKNFILF